MTGMFAPWWRDRTGREQVMLAVAGVLLLIVIGWLGILRPLGAARADAEARHAAAVSGLGDVAAMGGTIRAAEVRGGGAQGAPLIELVGERVRTAGLSAEALATSGDGRVTLRIAAVKPPVLLRWLGEIETRDGVIVDRLAITRNSDASVAVDLSVRRGTR